MKKNKTIAFMWNIIDQCNINCEYCGQHSRLLKKCDKKIVEDPNIQIAVAKKIVELASDYEEIKVRFVVSEPLMAKNIRQVIEILSTAPNIKTFLTTNMRLIDKIIDVIDKLDSMSISLHVLYRSDQEVEKIIDTVNNIKSKIPVVFSQVDYKLGDVEREKLKRIGESTGVSICYQRYLPAENLYTEEERQKILSDSERIKTLGKRCSLGYSFFSIEPDGSLSYGIWCFDKTRKNINNFAYLTNEEFYSLIPDDMAKCPVAYCQCNYNSHIFQQYLDECAQKGYPSNEIFHTIKILKTEMDYFLEKNSSEIKAIIFGADVRGKNTLAEIEEYSGKAGGKVNVIAFMDNDKRKWGNEIENKKVLEPNFENANKADVIIIGSTHTKVIREQLVNMGINTDKIIDNY